MEEKYKIGRLLTIKEAAEILRMSQRSLYRIMEARKLKVIKLSRKACRISEMDLMRFINSHRK